MADERTKLYCSRCLTSFTADVDECTNLACRRARPEGGWGQILDGGDIFDRTYRIHRLLAMGGGGITYLARELSDQDEEVGGLLAIKVLFAHRTQGSYLRRLATEAQILQELNHPHIVEYRGFVHRAGHAPYLVTRFEPGGSLLDHVRRVGTLPVRRAAAIGAQICAALEKGHESGVIHRDLKPENVLLTAEVTAEEDPTVRVVDFGIAKVSSSLHSNLTRAGAFVGTPHFASPEQFIGARIDPAADVYSVGAMLHFCMMGRHIVQFADRLAPEDGYDLLISSLPPSINRPSDPPADVERMNRILAVVMAPAPADRCSARQLRESLETLLRDEDPVLPAHTTAAQGDVPGPALPSTEPAPTLPTTSGSPTAQDTTSEAPAPNLTGSSNTYTEDTSGGTGRGCVVGLFLLGMPAGVLLLVLLFLWMNPGLLGSGSDGGEVLSPIDTNIPALTGRETDTDARRDYKRIHDSLENLKPYLQETCKLPAGTSIQIEVALSAAAAGLSNVEKARVQRGEDIPCVRQQLERAQVNRARSGPVRMPKVLEW